jgi:hypothetical protein
MSIILATDDQIFKCLSDGYNITETIKKCHCSFQRILPSIDKMKKLGKPVNRYGKFVNIEHSKKRKLARMEFLDRSGKKNWKTYMMNNPFYFQDVFNKEFSKEAVIQTANEMFD